MTWIYSSSRAMVTIPRPPWLASSRLCGQLDVDPAYMGTEVPGRSDYDNFFIALSIFCILAILFLFSVVLFVCKYLYDARDGHVEFDDDVCGRG